MRNILLLVIFLCGISVGMCADAKYKLYVNGNPSKTPIQLDKDQLWVPLSLSADPSVEEYTVAIHRDDAAREVRVDMHTKKRQVRGNNQCNVCLGTGKCPNDYPAGSGITTGGDPDFKCTGTGKCYYCGGAGTW